MKVMAINAVPYGSTGRIMFSLSEILLQKGDDSVCVTGFSWHKSSREEHNQVGTIWSKSFHMYMSRIFGNHGCFSRVATYRLIKRIRAFSPDIIHLHNIHGWYLNIPLLFDYLKETDASIVWTLHDCWAFTGGCAHFTFCRCDKWVTGCGGCNNLQEYPISSKRDKTSKMWQMKRNCFCSLRNLTIVTPSRWLSNLVKQSYLKKYPIQVINNGINLDTYKPSESDLGKDMDLLKDKTLFSAWHWDGESEKDWMYL